MDRNFVQGARGQRGRTLAARYQAYPFYDDWAWQRLLNGAETRVISKHEDPTLFFLEPNANYRLVRRDLFSRFDFTYPVGRLFEDPPVHFKMLASAARVGLVNIPYYWYRVNRPGKITEERSRRRFDILDVALETFSTLDKSDITPEAGGAIVYGLSRIVWWCGTMTLPEHRREYFQKACGIFADHAPALWVAHFGAYRFPDEIQHLVGGGLIRNEVDQLEGMSYGRRRPLRSLIFLLKIGRTDLILRKSREISGKAAGEIPVENPLTDMAIRATPKNESRNRPVRFPLPRSSGPAVPNERSSGCVVTLITRSSLTPEGEGDWERLQRVLSW